VTVHLVTPRLAVPRQAVEKALGIDVEWWMATSWKGYTHLRASFSAAHRDWTVWVNDGEPDQDIYLIKLC
jgi:hypothetical protein